MAKDAVAVHPSTPFESLVSDDVKQFIQAHNLDDSARTKLEALPLEQQVDVISQDVSNVRNMSAVVISRVTRCQREGSGFATPASQEYVGAIVDKFISMMGLDETSSAGLRGLPPRDQVAVMAKDMQGVTNPSGVVHSRVRKLKSGAGVGGYAVAGAGYGAGYMPAAPVHAAPVAVVAPMDTCEYLEQAYQAFLTQYRIDQRAQEQVAQLSPLEKLEVISQSMERVNNPSGVIASRCAKVRGQPVNLGPRAVQWVQEVIELFCGSYGIDPGSDGYQVLQQLSAEKQFEVCGQSLAGARNPQSVLYCRIQKLGLVQMPAVKMDTKVAARNPRHIGMGVVASPVGPFPRTTPAKRGNSGGAGGVEQFIQQYGLDERASTALRELAASDPTSAQEVMLQPMGEEVRNPSGVIHARIRKGGTRGRAAPY